MSGERCKNRHRLSKKEVKATEEEMIDAMGSVPFSPGSKIDVAQIAEWTVLLDRDEVVGVYMNDRLLPTIRGLLRNLPTGRYVTIDMGAVQFIASGADIMAPGIVEADESIEVGDVVWVRDEKNRKPIAIGTALLTGTEMVRSTRGKAVKNLHYVGDDIWRLGNR